MTTALGATAVFKLLIRRVALAVALVIAASALSYALVAAAPGNVAAMMAERMAGAKATRELIDSIAARLGLNDPLYLRYGRWVSQAVQGHWGDSLRTGHPISEEFAERAPITARLLAGGGVLVFVVPLALGVLGAMSNGGPVDQALRGLALLGASTPNFFLAALLVLLFSVQLHWLPSVGMGGVSSWVLPWITIAVFPACVLSRVVRVGLQEMMARPFATTGFAKGQSRAGVLIKEALPNLAVPFITTFAAQFALMIIGAIVVETVFAWQGLGALFLEAIRFRDLPVMQAVLMSFILFFVVLNLLADTACLLLDPRLRKSALAD